MKAAVFYNFNNPTPVLCFHVGSLDLIKDSEELMMTDKVWQEEPRKISTGPLADAEIFDRSKG